ncbi:MAG: hypothetical protein Q8R91_00960 [Candidatus Omnitrophota bacterium]|nr:hypothetical protein [Candidatus Omnitrophota bacterium]
MPKSLRVWGGLLGLWLWAGQADAVSLSTNRPTVKHMLAPGEAIQGSIEVENHNARPLSVKVYLEDWRYSDAGDGSKEFAVAGSLPRSCAGWVNVFPQALELPAHGRGVVDYTIRVPQGQPLDGGYYAALFFESTIAEGPVQGTGVSVRYAARLGSLVLVEVNGTGRHEGRLSSLSVKEPTASSPLTIHATLANEGNLSLACDGSFHIVAPGDLIMGRGDLPHRYVWPGVSAPITTEWRGSVEPGAYTVVITYDCGEGLILVEEAPWAVP